MSAEPETDEVPYLHIHPVVLLNMPNFDLHEALDEWMDGFEVQEWLAVEAQKNLALSQGKVVSETMLDHWRTLMRFNPDLEVPGA